MQSQEGGSAKKCLMGMVLIPSSPAYSQDGSACDMDTLVNQLDLHLDMISTTAAMPPPQGLAFSASGVLHRAPDEGSVSLGLLPDSLESPQLLAEAPVT